jgi:glyoxylase-like metal-dependent hydrolase (beta-lactamase superfamily II)
MAAAVPGRSGPAWVLVDTAWPGRAGIIRAAAETPFGLGTCPAAILLTHIHPDHGGSALELARMWELLVHVHPDDLWVTTLFERLATRATSTSALAQCCPPGH